MNSWHIILFVFGWAGCLFFVYAACVSLWTIWKQRRPTFEVKFLAWLERLRKTKGMIKPMPVGYILLGLLMCGAMVYGVSLQRWPDEMNHHIRIVDHPSPLQWWMVSDEHPDGTMYLACDDLPHFKDKITGEDRNGNEGWIFAGYFAPFAKWQVKGDCNSIRAAGYEFDYDWKKDGTAKTLREEGY